MSQYHQSSRRRHTISGNRGHGDLSRGHLQGGARGDPGCTIDIDGRMYARRPNDNRWHYHAGGSGALIWARPAIAARCDELEREHILRQDQMGHRTSGRDRYGMDSFNMNSFDMDSLDGDAYDMDLSDTDSLDMEPGFIRDGGMGYRSMSSSGSEGYPGMGYRSMSSSGSEGYPGMASPGMDPYYMYDHRGMGYGGMGHRDMGFQGMNGPRGMDDPRNHGSSSRSTRGRSSRFTRGRGSRSTRGRSSGRGRSRSHPSGWDPTDTLYDRIEELP